MQTLIDIIVEFYPIRFLPKGRKVIAATAEAPQQNIEMNILERRQMLKDSLYFSFEKNLDKFSPLRRAIKKYQELKQKFFTLKFNAIIGEIALAHAAIEQDLKNTLLYEWNVSETELKRWERYGGKLIDAFLRLIKERKVPSNFLSGYEESLECFRSISKERNNTVKALYAYDLAKGQHLKVDMEHFYRGRPNPFEQFVSSWHKKIEFKDLENLKKSLLEIRRNLLQLHSQVRWDKLRLFSSFASRIGDTVPGWVLNNPYLYKFIKELETP